MDFNDDENIEWLMESSKTVENVWENDVDFERREQESIELCRFLQVLRSSFESEPVLIESKAKGTVKHEEDVQKLIKNLKVLGYSFSIRSSNKKIDKANCKIMIVNKKSPPCSYPYIVLNHIRYYCSPKNKEIEDGNVEKPTNSRRVNNCKATLDVREIEIFTTMQLTNIRKKRIEMLKKLRRNLSTNSEEEAGELKYSVIISLPKIHNHSPRVKGQYLNDEVKAAMHYVLRSGTTSIEGVQEKLYQIVDREFENDPIKPSRDNTAFYPNLKTIYNHLRRDGLIMKKIYKKQCAELLDVKNKTRELLNNVMSKLDECNNVDVIRKIYKRTQSMLEVFDNTVTENDINLPLPSETCNS